MYSLLISQYITQFTQGKRFDMQYVKLKVVVW